MFRFRCGIGKVYGLVLAAIVFILVFILFSESGQGHAAARGPETGPSKRRNVKLISSDIPLLDQSKINEVETFLFFIGYPRSGHSIVAACLDAHPDTVIAHEFNLFQRLTRSDLHTQLMNRTVLYNGLYQSSVKAFKSGWRSPHSDRKGYTLHMNFSNSWQGKVRTLRVIGDKSGATTARTVRDSPILFEKIYDELKSIVQVPVKTLHVIRNPYDMVATRLLFRLSSIKGTKANFSASNPVTDKKVINGAIHGLRSEADAVKSFSEQRKPSVLEIHNVDYIHETRHVLLKVCAFLNLDCQDDFLSMCEKATFKQPSRSRQVLSWNKDHRKAMKRLIKDFPFFQRYSFESE